MTDRVKTAPRDTSRALAPDPTRRTTSWWLWAGAVGTIAVILIVWLIVLPDTAEQTDAAPSAENPAAEVIAKPDPGVVDPQGNDVEAVTEDAPVPGDDANPNPVVPQDALIPPAPIDDAPPE
jgi:hypothetical protein